MRIGQLVVQAVAAEPGIWIAKLCRKLNGLDEGWDSIAHCGLCKDYANPRKRKRAKYWATVWMLPGFERPYQLHKPCPYRLSSIQRVARTNQRIERRREKIPDHHQDRGWDFGTRLYPKGEQ